MRSAFALRIFSGKIIFNRAMPERLRTLRHCIFKGRGRKGKRQLPRLLPAEAAARRERFYLTNSLSQNLTVLPAPSGREPLARPETLRLSRKLYRYAKGHPRGGWHRVAMTGGVPSRKYPFRLAASRQATFPKGTAFVVAGSFAAVPKSSP